MKKQFIGTCVNNPFRTTAALSAVIEQGREISRRTFLVCCEVPADLRAQMLKFPRDYRFFRSENVLFFELSRIEHFYQ